jgi:hypothetical protein
MYTYVHYKQTAVKNEAEHAAPASALARAACSTNLHFFVALRPIPVTLVRDPSVLRPAFVTSAP